MRKAPKIGDCVRFPQQKVKYCVTSGHAYLKGYDSSKDDIIWTHEKHGFFYLEDAIYFMVLAKSFGYIMHLVSVEYPSCKEKYIKIS